MKKIIHSLFIISIIITLSFSNDKTFYGVFDLTTGNTSIVKNRLFGGITSTSDYYSAQLNDFKAAVIIHGHSYKFFLKDLSKSKYKNNIELLSSQTQLYKMFKTLHDSYNVEFYVCGAGLRKYDLNKDDIYDFVKIIPTAITGLIDMQNSGYAYIPITD